ncbi:MAG: ABC transporter ATP-binding protein [Solirubrobacterales bacterium]
MEFNNYEVQLKSIYKSYGTNIVLENLNMNFLKNKITVVTGPSGCGKTTMLNIISGLENADSGEVLMSDKSISYIFQEDRLLPQLTVYQNIAFVLKSYMTHVEMKPVIEKYLSLVKMIDSKDKYPVQLSGGMKRRVAIARAFAYKSRLLLMDEPFKGLDDKLKTEIINQFLQVYRADKRTIIFVTHDMKEAEMLSDVIYTLK